jgi:gliding motility-associated-like protein
MDTATRNIRIHPTPTVTMPAEITILAGSPIKIPAVYSWNMSSYLWTPSNFLSCTTCPQPTVTPDFDKQYLVNFTDSNNCSNSGTIQVKTSCNNASLFMPNTFSPNDDGSNDVFYPRGRGLANAKFLRIFNRWGEIVFERYNFPVNDLLKGWNGTKNGKKVNPDVYIYQIEVYCLNGELITSQGNIALIR